MLVVWIVVSQILVLVLQVLVLVVVIVVVVKIHDAVVMKKTKGMYANDIIL